MEWEITLHDNPKYVEFTTHGIADVDGSLEMARAVADTMRRHRITNVLIDHRNIESVSGKVIEVISRPKIFRLIGLVLGIRIAEIINPDHLEHFKFLETVCKNRGYNISVFYDRASALEWLLR
ncbi:MAG: hypothetical protein EHM64_16070 [Ignavibacteriae bacterium]|nr:MAG: hypothetical protein EHM64_16070 [Ignavibacteriota bacterium]